MKIIKNSKKIIKDLYADYLYKNSFYLMLSNLVNGLLGFVFLMIATRLYSSEDVGMYSALFSAMSLIVLFSMSVGFLAIIVRHVPNEPPPDRNKLIFSSFAIVCFIVTIISFVFVFFIELFSPKLIFLKDLFYGFVFILFTVFVGIHGLFNGVFMVFRKTHYILISDIITNIGKIFLLFLFVPLLYIGIFYSVGIAAFLETVICLFLVYKAKLLRNFKLNINFDIIKKNFDYILTNYFLSIASLLPGLLFPMLILNIFSAEMTAYFYLAWAMFSTILLLVMSITSSFFVEGSYEKTDVKKNRDKAIKMSLIIVTISIFGVFLFGKSILSLFGEQYLNALNLLYVLTVSTYFWTMDKFYLTELLIKKKMKEALMFNFLIAATIIASGTLLMFYFGLIGIGYGWIIGHAIGIIWILARLIV